MKNKVREWLADSKGEMDRNEVQFLQEKQEEQYKSKEVYFYDTCVVAA